MTFVQTKSVVPRPAVRPVGLFRDTFFIYPADEDGVSSAGLTRVVGVRSGGDEVIEPGPGGSERR